MAKHKYTVIIVLSLLFSMLLPTSAVFADTGKDFYSSRYEAGLSLPHEEKLTFSHKESGTSHNILDSRTFSFRADTGGIVSILFSNGSAKETESEAYNILRASVYTDEGKKICEEQTDAVSNTSHIEFVSAYGGIYFLVLESRAAVAGEYDCEFSISSVSSYQKNKLDSFPNQKEYSERTHKSLSFSELFSNSKYDNADNYKVSIFEFSHEAGSIFSYKLNIKEDGLAPYAVVMSYDGALYTPHISNEGEGYACGDAVELSYNAHSYLFVFSDGNFTLEADLLLHQDYNITELGSSFSGMLSTSGMSLMYDSESFDKLTQSFPFSDIKNREAIFYSVSSPQSSVVSYLSDRGEHKFLTIVSESKGLSPRSVYPLREYGEYCSEISPSELCYSAYINDSTKFYICYTGTSSEIYLEIQSSPTHTSTFSPAEKYKPDDILSSVAIQNIYSDVDIFKRLGIEKNAPDLMKIGGYMLVDETGCRYYFSPSGEIKIPNVDGKIKLYVIVDCEYNSNTEAPQTEHYYFLVSELISDRGFFAPMIEDVVDYVKANPIIGITVLIVSFGAIVAARFFAAKSIKQGNSPTPSTDESADGEDDAPPDNEEQ